MTIRRMICELAGIAVLWLAAIGVLWSCSGCKSGNAAWNVQNGQMSTQFEVSWGTSVKIGFPGMLHGDAKGKGELRGDGEPAPTPVPQPTP